MEPKDSNGWADKALLLAARNADLDLDINDDPVATTKLPQKIIINEKRLMPMMNLLNIRVI